MSRATRIPGFGLIAWISLGLLYAPILVLLAFSLNAGRLVNRWEGLSLDWYRAALADDGFRRAAWNTFVVSGSGTLLATALALGAALGLYRATQGQQRWAMMILGLPLVVPEIVMAIAVMVVFARLGPVDLGIGRLVLGHVTFCIPFALMPIRAALGGLDHRLTEAARDLHAAPWQITRRVTLPVLLPAILSGAALAFITSFDDFAMTQFVAGPGQTTLPVYIWGQLRRPLTPEINAMCGIVLIVSATVICLATALGGARRPSPFQQGH